MRRITAEADCSRDSRAKQRGDAAGISGPSCEDVGYFVMDSTGCQPVRMEMTSGVIPEDERPILQ